MLVSTLVPEKKYNQMDVSSCIISLKYEIFYGLLKNLNNSKDLMLLSQVKSRKIEKKGQQIITNIFLYKKKKERKDVSTYYRSYKEFLKFTFTPVFMLSFYFGSNKR